MDRLYRRSTRGFVAAAFGFALVLATMPAAAGDPPAGKKAADAKPADAKPADAKAADEKPAGDKSADVKPDAAPSTDSAPPTSTDEEAAAPEEQEPPRKKKKKKKPSEQPGPPTMRMPELPPPPPEYVLPLLPRRLDYEEGDVIMPEYQLKTRGDRALLTSGALAFGIPYVVSSLFGFGAAIGGGSDSEVTPLLIPLVGPFISASSIRGGKEPYAAFFLLTDGFAQIAGVAMFTAGLVFPTQYLEVRPEALAKTRPELFVGPGSISVRARF